MDETDGNGRGREGKNNKGYVNLPRRKCKHLDLLRNVRSKVIYCPSRVRVAKGKGLRQPSNIPSRGSPLGNKGFACQQSRPEMFVVLPGAQCLSSRQEGSGTEEQNERQLRRNDLSCVWVMGQLGEHGNLGIDKSDADYRNKETFSSCGR